jgi:formylglycine-generating enzyme required for sulfatase activity
MFLGCVIIPLLLAVGLVGVYSALRAAASGHLTVPDKNMVHVRALPNANAALLARFGAGSRLKIIGRTANWRWLQVELWDGQRGWILRPLDILVWQLAAPVVQPQPPALTPPAPVLVDTPMVTIPAGVFTMGSPPGLGEPDEEPAHAVTLSAFALDKTEVSQGQYWQCVETGSCAPPQPDTTYRLNNPAFDAYPVTNMPWTEANRYCLWQGKRLPTEAEWEMAAGWDANRGAKLLWPWGNSAAGATANLNGGSAGQPAPVGSHPEDISPLGVLDMGGNVKEWVFDWYKVDYYNVADNTNPQGPTQRRGEGSGRSVRGASFANPPEQARTANRRHQDAAYGYPTVGFRCAQSIN